MVTPVDEESTCSRFTTIAFSKLYVGVMQSLAASNSGWSLKASSRILRCPFGVLNLQRQPLCSLRADFSADSSTNKLRGVTPRKASKAAVGVVFIAPVALRQTSLCK